MQAREFPRGNASASPFETRRFAAFLRVRGDFWLLGQLVESTRISPYIDDDLRAGRLVAPFDISVAKGMHWYLIYRDARRDEPGFAAFRKWVVDAAR